MDMFTIGHKRVFRFPSAAPNRPVVYWNAADGQGTQVWAALRASGCPDFTLVAVEHLAWNQDMAPWDSPPVSPHAAPCTGGADAYLALLLEEILPRAESARLGTPPWRGIGGYSLAGLFAVYALCRTDAFSRAASVSGSLWYPGIRDYLFTHPPRRRPDCLYFSLGSRESKTRNPLLRGVRESTQAIEAFYRGQGIDTTFQLNSGNHFQDIVARSAAGIGWMLRR